MLHRYSFTALGSEVTVAVFEKSSFAAASDIAVTMGSAIDRAVNHDYPAAEIHAFDNTHGQRVVVSSLLRITLERAIMNAKVTNGILNPLRRGEDQTPQGPWKEILIESDEVSIPSGYHIETRAAARAGLSEDIAHRISTQLNVCAMVIVGRVITFAGPHEPEGGWKFNTNAHNHLYDVVTVPNNEAVSVTPTNEIGLPHLPWRTVAVQARSALFADALARAVQIDPAWTTRKIVESGVNARLTSQDGKVNVFGNWQKTSESAVNKLLDHTDQFAAINFPGSTSLA